MGGAYPSISQTRRRNWDHLTPFFACPADLGKVIYTTNMVEPLNMSLRKVIKTRGSFPDADAAMKPLYLALEHIARKWTKSFIVNAPPPSKKRSSFVQTMGSTTGAVPPRSPSNHLRPPARTKVSSARC